MNDSSNQGWFITANGLQVWIDNPVAKLIRTDDIADALSRICRFGGHLDSRVEHYSVAQHSLLVCDLCPDSLARAALMHDAAEAYLGDVIRPLKRQLAEYLALEERWQEAIDERFGFSLSIQDCEAIARADGLALCLERRDLLNRAAVKHHWPSIASEALTALPNTRIVALGAAEARVAFAQRAQELGLWVV